MGLFIEERILNAVKSLLAGRVNELLGEMDCPVPPVKFGGGYAPVGVCDPVISLAACERSEKERIVRADVYSVSITFSVPEGPEAERDCYAYASAAARALAENPALGRVAGRAVITGKKYNAPKYPGTGGVWELVLSLRITVEGTNV
jgi:hypothetical protein